MLNLVDEELTEVLDIHFALGSVYDSTKTLKDVETGAEDGKKETYSTESLAKFAFSIFWRAMKFAKENRTPVLFDY